jgi:Protein of unknown function (DUF3570)
MKKKYLVIGALALSHCVIKAQGTDSLYKKEILNKTDITVLYNQYLQNGDHSAITGGIGTEKLQVYAPAIEINSTIKTKNIITFKGGADIITSASTDRIDFVLSSASLHDTRTYANLSYGRWFEKNDLLVSLGTGFSLESAYLSFPVNMGLVHTEKNKMRTYSVDLQLNFDDLRWGRLSRDHSRPVGLVYPVELRYKDWYSTYLRNSYNLKLGFSQVITKRLILGLYPEMTYQKGLLATPYHRVYFTDGSERVENLPYQRWKGSLGLKANYFLGGRTIFKNGISVYEDDFGILGIAFENETSIKVNNQVSLSPFFRIYYQKGSPFFAPYGQHDPLATYYTSDYDLSTFNSYKAGLSLRYAPFTYIGKRSVFNELNLRYAFYYRSNALMAHILSLVMNLSFEGKSKK